MGRLMEALLFASVGSRALGWKVSGGKCWGSPTLTGCLAWPVLGPTRG
jgi:hypothetical protein